MVDPDNPDSLEALYRLGWVLFNQGRYKSAEELVRKLVETCCITVGDENPVIITAQELLATIFRIQGLYTKAEKLLERVLTSTMRIMGDEHQEL